jgi:gliding motility-associated-like protein
MKGKLAIVWFLVFTLGIVPLARASHIVGGEFVYNCKNNEVGTGYIKYDINFKLYMDCINGQIDAINREDNGYFVVYDAVTKRALDTIVKYRTTKDYIPADFENSCVTNPPNTCLLRNTYDFTLTLPDNGNGYYVATNNCCRNGTIVNINNPSETGASYFIFLPPRSLFNNSARFSNLPPQIICVNNPFLYDNSATDPDGDSLSYAFGPAFQAITSTSGNQIAAQFSPPPYPSVNYGFGILPSRPMPGNPILQINPQTGIISGTPNQQGIFVVSVYCYEWRNGIKIDSVMREFQFVVTNCSKSVVANIPQYSEEFNTYVVQCKSLTVGFENLSTGGEYYHWDFGVPGIVTDTSNEVNPVYTYPDTGTYVVKLYVNHGSTCQDSINRFVKVYPTFFSDFSFDGLHCPGSVIQFHDSSYGSRASISWSWDFGDSTFSDIKDPTHVYDSGDTYPVVLISKNDKGCIDTVKEDLFIEDFRPFAGNDTIIVKGESINYNASGGSTYRWMPATNLSDSEINNPVGYYPDSGHFAYNVYIKSDYGCEGNDSIKVWVVNQSAIFVPSAFSPNGDGLNETLRPIGIGYRNMNFFRVYNRWGQQVFYTTKFNEGWNGIFNGTVQDIGTYFWVLSMNNRFGKEELVKGDCILVR